METRIARIWLLTILALLGLVLVVAAQINHSMLQHQLVLQTNQRLSLLSLQIAALREQQDLEHAMAQLAADDDIEQLKLEDPNGQRVFEKAYQPVASSLSLDSPLLRIQLWQDKQAIGWLSLKLSDKEISEQWWLGFWQLLALLVLIGGLAFLIARWRLALVLEFWPVLCQRAERIVRKYQQSSDHHQQQWLEQALTVLEHELQSSLAERVQLANHIREHTFSDENTGLANRRFFDKRLEMSVLSRDEAVQGAVLLLHLQHLESLEPEASRQLLQQVSLMLDGALEAFKGAIIARRGESDFGLLIPEITPQQAQKLARKILSMLKTLHLPLEVDVEDFAHIGIAFYYPGAEPYQILAEADMALRTAQMQGPNSCYMFEEGSLEKNSVKGSVRWRVLLENVIERRQIEFYFQQVLRFPQQPLYQETLARLRDEHGELVNAAIFVPMAYRCGLLGKLDRLIIDSLLKFLHNEGHELGDCALNVSADSLCEPGFEQWLVQKLAEQPRMAHRIIIECAEYGVNANLERLIPVFETLRGLGCRLAIDHVGQAITSTAYLSELKPDILKLHSSLIRRIDEDREHRVFIQSLVSLCEELGTILLAEGVESAGEWQALAELGLTGGQGYFISRPQKAKTLLKTLQGQ